MHKKFTPLLFMFGFSLIHAGEHQPLLVRSEEIVIPVLIYQEVPLRYAVGTQTDNRSVHHACENCEKCKCTHERSPWCDFCSIVCLSGCVILHAKCCPCLR